MTDLILTDISDDNSGIFHTFMREYARELDEHQHRTTAPDILSRWTDSIIIRSRGEHTRLLKLCCVGDEAIGFLYAKLDLPDDRGCKRVGQGCILEFYVAPAHRRKGYGRAMFREIERFFAGLGAAKMYLTADPVTGKPFWSAMGFIGTGEHSPDNGQEIFERAV